MPTLKTNIIKDKTNDASEITLFGSKFKNEKNLNYSIWIRDTNRAHKNDAIIIDLDVKTKAEAVNVFNIVASFKNITSQKTEWFAKTILIS